MVNGLIAPGIDNPEEQAEQTLLQQLSRLTDDGITPMNFSAPSTDSKAASRYSKAGILAKAQALAKAAMQGYDINSVTARYRALTVDHVNATARALLRPDRSATLLYRPTH